MEGNSIIDRYIQEIVNQTGLSREEVEREIEKIEHEKIPHVSKRVRRLAAVIHLANSLNVKIFERVEERTLKISELRPGITNIRIIGRVIAVFEIQTVDTEWEVLKIRRILIGDDTGEAFLILWRENTDLIERKGIKQGDIIEANRVYCKEGRGNIIELHLATQGDIRKIEDVELPEREYFFREVDEIEEEKPRVNVRGIIEAVAPISTFERSDGSVGRVRRIVIKGERKRLRGVLWDAQTDKVQEEDIGRECYFVGVSIRRGITGELEFSVNRNSYIELGEKKEELESPIDIKEIYSKRDGEYVNLIATVVKVFKKREVQIGGLKRTVQEILLTDGTEFITLNIWEEDTEVKEGDIIRIDGGRVRIDKYGGRRIDAGRESSIKTLGEKKEEVKEPFYMIGKLYSGLRNVCLEGLVMEEPFLDEVTTIKGEKVDRGVTRIADDSGEIEVLGWREEAKKISILRKNQIIRLRWVNITENPQGRLVALLTSNSEIETLG